MGKGPAVGAAGEKWPVTLWLCPACDQLRSQKTTLGSSWRRSQRWALSQIPTTEFCMTGCVPSASDLHGVYADPYRESDIILVHIHLLEPHSSTQGTDQITMYLHTAPTIAPQKFSSDGLGYMTEIVAGGVYILNPTAETSWTFSHLLGVNAITHHVSFSAAAMETCQCLCSLSLSYDD